MQTLFVYLFSSVLLTLSPGPDLLLVMTLSLQHSMRKVIFFIVGLCCGLFIHTLLLVLGWQSFLAEYPQAIRVFKTLGAFYFCYLALLTLLSDQKNSSKRSLDFSDAFSLWKKGIFMNVLNPKVGLFFWLFFPGFLFSESLTIGTQYLVLGVLFAIQAFGVMTLMGFLASRIKEKGMLEPLISSNSLRYFTAILLAILGIYIGVF